MEFWESKLQSERNISTGVWRQLGGRDSGGCLRIGRDKTGRIGTERGNAFEGKRKEAVEVWDCIWAREKLWTTDWGMKNTERTSSYLQTALGVKTGVFSIA